METMKVIVDIKKGEFDTFIRIFGDDYLLATMISQAHSVLDSNSFDNLENLMMVLPLYLKQRNVRTDRWFSRERLDIKNLYSQITEDQKKTSFV
jgi:hypothetical protein